MLKKKLSYLPFIIGLLSILAASLYFVLVIQRIDFTAQTFWLFEMHKCFLDGQIPCRWSPDLGGVYGYPLFNYQGPFPYYLGELVYQLTGNYSVAVKILFVLSIGGIYLINYFLIKNLFPRLNELMKVLLNMVLTLVCLYFVNSLNVTWTIISLLFVILLLLNSSKIHFRILAPMLALSVFVLITSYQMNIIFSCMIIFGWIFLKAKRKQLFTAKSLFVSLLVGLLLAAFYWLPMITELGYVGAKTVVWGDFANNYQVEKSVLPYLPKYVTDPPLHPASSEYRILTGEMEVVDFQRGTNWIKFIANVNSHSIIRLSQYYFPNWKITANGQDLNIDYNNNLGLMTFILGAGQYQIEAKLEDTPIRIVANSLSIAGFVAMGFLILLQSKHIRKWVNYYLEVFAR